MSCGLKKCFDSDCLNKIYQVLKEVRSEIEEDYGTSFWVAGCCIMASRRIEEELHKLGCDKVKTVEGLVECDFLDEETKETEMPHMWVEVSCGDEFLYIDVTADQFNCNMKDEHQYDPIVMCDHRPYGVMLPPPGTVMIS